MACPAIFSLLAGRSALTHLCFFKSTGEPEMSQLSTYLVVRVVYRKGEAKDLPLTGARDQYFRALYSPHPVEIIEWEPPDDPLELYSSSADLIEEIARSRDQGGPKKVLQVFEVGTADRGLVNSLAHLRGMRALLTAVLFPVYQTREGRRIPEDLSLVRADFDQPGLRLVGYREVDYVVAQGGDLELSEEVDGQFDPCAV